MSIRGSGTMQPTLTVQESPYGQYTAVRQLRCYCVAPHSTSCFHLVPLFSYLVILPLKEGVEGGRGRGDVGA